MHLFIELNETTRLSFAKWPYALIVKVLERIILSLMFEQIAGHLQTFDWVMALFDIGLG